jgi:hypothetical protein
MTPKKMPSGPKGPFSASFMSELNLRENEKSGCRAEGPGTKQQILRSVAARPEERDAKAKSAATPTQNDTGESVLVTHWAATQTLKPGATFKPKAPQRD